MHLILTQTVTFAKRTSFLTKNKTSVLTRRSQWVNNTHVCTNVRLLGEVNELKTRMLIIDIIIKMIIDMIINIDIIIIDIAYSWPYSWPLIETGAAQPGLASLGTR